MRRAFLFAMLIVTAPTCFSGHVWGGYLDSSPRARAVRSYLTFYCTEAKFRSMQAHYRPKGFDIWAARLRQLRPGMTWKQVYNILGGSPPREFAADNTLILNDAYFAQIYFDRDTRRMTFATPPLAIEWDVVVPSTKRSKT